MQDADQQRQVALEYVQRFEEKLLPAKAVLLPRSTRVQRVQVSFLCASTNFCILHVECAFPQRLTILATFM